MSGSTHFISLHLTELDPALALVLLFQQKMQVLEPIKISHGHLRAQGSPIRV
jgi:hypothetical protein